MRRRRSTPVKLGISDPHMTRRMWKIGVRRFRDLIEAFASLTNEAVEIDAIKYFSSCLSV